MIIVNLAQATVGNAGPKMGRLGELIRRGIEVPRGFVVSPAAFPGTAHPDRAVEAAIRTAYRQLCTEGDELAVAVRSSATDEDGADASFAGVFDSFLGVVGADAVIDAVRACWSGLHSRRATAYRKRLGTPTTASSMGVGVMRLVSARASGVVFTLDPVTGRDDRMTVEATVGFGEPVVQGAVVPDRIDFGVDDGRILRYEVGDKRVALVAAKGGGMRSIKLAPERAQARALDDTEVRKICELARAVAEVAGRPVDCEWVLNPQGDVWIVQWRPITATGMTAGPQTWDPAEYAARYAFRSD